MPSARDPPPRLAGSYSSRSASHSRGPNSPRRGTSSSRNDMELTTMSSSGGNFQAESNEVSRMLDHFKQSVNQIQSLHQRSLTASRDEANRLTRQIDALSDECSTMLSTMRSKIQQLSPKNYRGNDKAMRKNAQTRLAKDLYEAAQRYQRVQAEFRGQVKGKLERQYRIVRPDASQDEINEYISSGGGQQQVFSSAMVASKSQALAAYKEAETRHHQLVKIEESITQLFNLMTEMSVLLDQQGEQLDQIEAHTEDTVVQLNEASKQMTKAIEHRKSSRKRAWCICALVLVLLSILMIILYFYVIRPAMNDSKKDNNNKSSSLQAASDDSESWLSLVSDPDTTTSTQSTAPPRRRVRRQEDPDYQF